MEQTIKTNCLDGKKAVYNEETRNMDFVDIKTKSKSWKEFCENHPDTKGEYAVLAESITQASSTTLRTLGKWYNLFNTKEDAEGIVAFMKLIRLHDEWVEVGFHLKPQCYIYYDYTENKICISGCPHTLWFPSIELALEFLDCHRDLIEKAKRFI